MKNKLLTSLFLSTSILFIGCSSKNVELETSSTNTTEAVSSSSTNENSTSSTQSAVEGEEAVSSVSNEQSTNSTANAIAQPFLENVYFDYKKYGIKVDMKDISSKNAKALAAYLSINKDQKIKLEGNCDPVGSDAYNYALGLKRANAVKQELLKAGVAEEQIVMVTLGESNPVCSENTKECHAKDRRVEYKLP